MNGNAVAAAAANHPKIRESARMVEFRCQALSLALAALASLAATAQALPQAAPALRLALTNRRAACAW